MKQLSSVERYALNLMEWSEREWRAEQLRAADAELEAASAGVDATDKLEEMAEEVIRQDRNKSPVEEAPPPPKKVQKDRIKTRQKSLQNNGLPRW